MKKIYLLLICSFVALTFCTTSKNAMGGKKKEATLYYDKDIAPILVGHCTPCHFPDAGRKLPLDTYIAVHDHVDEILMRVQLPHDDPKFMPFKSKKEPLSDSLIAVIKLWKEEGMAEKTIE